MLQLPQLPTKGGQEAGQGARLGHGKQEDSLLGRTALGWAQVRCRPTVRLTQFPPLGFSTYPWLLAAQFQAGAVPDGCSCLSGMARLLVMKLGRQGKTVRH